MVFFRVINTWWMPMCVCEGSHAHRSEKDISRRVVSFSTLFPQGWASPWTWSKAGKPSGPLVPIPQQRQGYRYIWPYTAFYMGVVDLNSGPRACTASVLIFWAISPALCPSPTVKSQLSVQHLLRSECKEIVTGCLLSFSLDSVLLYFFLTNIDWTCCYYYYFHMSVWPAFMSVCHRNAVPKNARRGRWVP